MRIILIAVVVGLLLGWGSPVLAQVAVRIFGTTSGGVILPVLVDSQGRLVVVES